MRIVILACLAATALPAAARAAEDALLVWDGGRHCYRAPDAKGCGDDWDAGNRAFVTPVDAPAPAPVAAAPAAASPDINRQQAQLQREWDEVQKLSVNENVAEVQALDASLREQVGRQLGAAPAAPQAPAAPGG